MKRNEICIRTNNSSVQIKRIAVLITPLPILSTKQILAITPPALQPWRRPYFQSRTRMNDSDAASPPKRSSAWLPNQRLTSSGERRGYGNEKNPGALVDILRAG
jgi:hypothetical protein